MFVQLYMSNRETVKSELGTFMDVFPNAIVWGNTMEGQGYDLVLTGQAEPFAIDVDELQARLGRPDYAEVAASLREIGFGSAVELLSSYAASRAEIAPWLSDAVINRDRNLRLQYFAGMGATLQQSGPIYAEMAVTAPIIRGNRYFYARRPPAQDRPVVYVREGALGAERVLVDPAVAGVAAGQVTWLSPSEDGKLLAYGAFRPADNASALLLLDVESASPLPLEIAGVQEAAQWLPDGTGFIYHSLKDPRDPYSRQGLFHRMGTPPSADQVLYRQVAPAENARLAPGGGPSGTLSRDGRWLLLSYHLDAGTNDIWLSRFDEYRQKGARAARVVSVGASGRAEGTVIGDTLLLHTTKGAARGRVVAANVAAPEQARWREIVPERQEAIEGVSFGRGVVAVSYVRNAATVIEVFDFNGKALGTLNQPTIGSASLTASEDRTEAYLNFASFNYPPTIFRVDLATPGAAPKYWSGPDVPVDPASMEVTQVWYPSKDGTKISMFLTRKKGQALKRRRSGARVRLRRVQREPGADVRRALPAVVRGRRRACGAESSRWRRIRRGLASGRHARPEEEQRRRSDRRGRVADREQVHELTAAGSVRAVKRRARRGRGDGRAPRALSRRGPRRPDTRHAALPQVRA